MLALSIFLTVYDRRVNTGPIYSLSETGFSKINFSKGSMGMIDSEVRVLSFKVHHVLEIKNYYMLPCSQIGRMHVF